MHFSINTFVLSCESARFLKRSFLASAAGPLCVGEGSEEGDGSLAIQVRVIEPGGWAPLGE